VYGSCTQAATAIGAIRDDVRTNRLQIPAHVLAAEQAPQPAATNATAGDGSANDTNAGLSRRQKYTADRDRTCMPCHEG
jgi:hypothetical protein